MRRLCHAAILLALGCSGAPPPNLDSPGTTIVCLGDSLTAGVGSDAGAAYPEVLSRLVGEPVINAGVPGDTAAGALARLDAVLDRDPWLVVVEIGGNDLLRHVPIERTEAALDRIVERLLAARVAPLLVAIHGPFGGRYAEMYERVADGHGVPLLDDLLPDLETTPRFKSDPIHLNSAGYRRLAEGIAAEIRPWIESRRKAAR